MVPSSWSQLITTDNVIALFTAMAVTIAAFQIRANTRLSREALARQLWLDYLKAGLAYPMLSETRAAMGVIGTTDVGETVDGRCEHSQQYLWMITLMLDSCDSIIRYLPRREWEDTLVEQVRLHRPALRLIWDPGLKMYYPRHIQTLVEKGLNLPEREEEWIPVVPAKAPSQIKRSASKSQTRQAS